jgi:hypothetical protein
MAGSDPAGRPLRARLGHRQRPQGPSHFWTAADSRRTAATPGAPERVSATGFGSPSAGISVGVGMLTHVWLWLAEAPGAAVDN